MGKKKYDTNVGEFVKTEENIVERKNDIVVDKETVVEETIFDDNIMICNVIKALPDNKAIINFEGFGLIISLKENVKSVNVKYIGKIGTPDFKYEVV